MNVFVYQNKTALHIVIEKQKKKQSFCLVSGYSYAGFLSQMFTAIEVYLAKFESGRIVDDRLLNKVKCLLRQA